MTSLGSRETGPDRAPAPPRRLVFDAELIAQRDYWLERLGRSWSAPGLPLGEHPGPIPEPVDLVVPRQAFERLEKIAAGSPFLVYALLMSVLKVCLYRYGGRGALAVGSPLLSASAGEGPAEAGHGLVMVDEVEGEMSVV